MSPAVDPRAPLRTPPTFNPDRVGMLFFVQNGIPTSCSGTSVDPGTLGGVVETAAHCMVDPEDSTATLFQFMVFAPAYDGNVQNPDRRAPFGVFPAIGGVTSGITALSSIQADFP